MPQYTLDQKLEAFRKLMEDEEFWAFDELYNIQIKKYPDSAKETDKRKENYIIEAYPELFG